MFNIQSYAPEKKLEFTAQYIIIKNIIKFNSMDKYYDNIQTFLPN